MKQEYKEKLIKAVSDSLQEYGTLSLRLPPLFMEVAQATIFAAIVMWFIAYFGAVLADDLQCHSLGFSYGYANPVTFSGYCKDDLYGYIPLNQLGEIERHGSTMETATSGTGISHN